jgi:hypothetical protein
MGAGISAVKPPMSETGQSKLKGAKLFETLRLPETPFLEATASLRARIKVDFRASHRHGIGWDHPEAEYVYHPENPARKS